MAKFSTGLRNEMLAGQSLKDTLDGGMIQIYSGTEPATADDGIGSATPILTLTVDGTGGGLHFSAAAVNGTLSKDASEIWKGEIQTTDSAAWFRFVAPGDTGAASTTEARIQGSIGVAGTDMLMANTTLTETEEFTLNYYTVVLPTL